MLVSDKDVVQVIVGAASGIAGLTLVFLGFIIAARSGYDSDTPAAVLNRYRSPALTALAAFAVSVACAAVGVWWLIDGGANDLALDLAVGLFAAQLVLLLIATTMVVTRVWSD